MAGNPPQTLWGGSFHSIFKCKNYDFLKKKAHLGVAVFWQWIIRGGSLVSLTGNDNFSNLENRHSRRANISQKLNMVTQPPPPTCI